MSLDSGMLGAVLIPPRRFDAQVPEMMDRPGSSPDVLRDDLKNLRVINKYFGGLRAVRRHIMPMFDMFGGKEIHILDLATASGDHPVALARLARRLQKKITITAVDKNPIMLQVARERTSGIPEIRIEEADLLHLPYQDKSYDIVLCSLVLHHFAREEAVTLIRNIHGIARIGWIVHDLNRSWRAAWTAWLYTHLTIRNPMTLYDSYCSVLRAFTPEELAALARDSGVKNFEIHEERFFRLILVGTKALEMGRPLGRSGKTRPR